MEVVKATREFNLLQPALKARASSTINGAFVPARRPREQSEQARLQTAREHLVQMRIKEAYEQPHVLLRPALLARARSVVNGKFVPARRPREQSREIRLLNAHVFLSKMRLGEAAEKIKILEVKLREAQYNTKLEKAVLELTNKSVCSATLELVREECCSIPTEPVTRKTYERNTVLSDEPPDEQSLLTGFFFGDD